jgi:hypothetical protein
VILLVLAAACGGVQTVPASFQIDVHSSGLEDTDRLRVCVEEAVVHEEAVGHGRIAINGLREADQLVVSAHHIDGDMSLGYFEGVELTLDQPSVEVEWILCSDDCTPCTVTSAVSNIGQKSRRILAIQIID